jgi:hypothetical protein
LHAFRTGQTLFEGVAASWRRTTVGIFVAREHGGLLLLLDVG